MYSQRLLISVSVLSKRKSTEDERELDREGLGSSENFVTNFTDSGFSHNTAHRIIKRFPLPILRFSRPTIKV